MVLLFDIVCCQLSQQPGYARVVGACDAVQPSAIGEPQTAGAFAVSHSRARCAAVTGGRVRQPSPGFHRVGHCDRKGTCADKTEREDCALRRLRIRIVRELRERVHHRDAWVRDVEQPQPEWHSPADVGLAVLRAIRTA